MTLEEFVAILSDEYATAEFEYNGKRCGIEPETSDSNTTYGYFPVDRRLVLNLAGKEKNCDNNSRAIQHCYLLHQ